MSIRLFYLSIVFTFLINAPLVAQEQESPKLVIKPILSLQLWATYTDGQSLYDAGSQQYVPVDNRLNFLLHRSRSGIKGSYGDQWVYNFTTSLDFVGQDLLAGTVGAANNGASPRFRIWNAFVQYKIKPTSEALNLTFGYMGPQYSRESITSPFTTNSFEKAWSQNYIRRHIAGSGPGRLVGLNVGGLMNKGTNKLAFNYDLGIYNPRYTDFSGNSSGQFYSPLLTYRLGIHIGDPEYQKYSWGHKFNYKGARNGVTLSVSGSQQGKASLWDDNTSFGVDMLANFGNLNLAGEWMQLKRSLGTVESKSTTGFIKAGYYLKLANQKELEPVLTYVYFNGPRDARSVLDATSIGSFTGQDNYIEATLNYYVSNKIRLSLSYTLREGDNGDQAPETVGNNYYFQGGVGPIQKGNYLGFGLLFSI